MCQGASCRHIHFEHFSQTTSPSLKLCAQQVSSWRDIINHPVLSSTAGVRGVVSVAPGGQRPTSCWLGLLVNRSPDLLNSNRPGPDLLTPAADTLGGRGMVRWPRRCSPAIACSAVQCGAQHKGINIMDRRHSRRRPRPSPKLVLLTAQSPKLG